MRGARLGFPIFLGYMPVGMAFGVIATTIGFSIPQATVCSATALAGAGQLIALSLMRAGEGAVAVVAATTIVNLRYLLFAATLSPHLRRTSLSGQAVLAFTLTDETFAINITDRRSGLSSAMSMAGVGAIAWVGWVGGTVIGASATAWIGDPSRFGVDFAMPAMFTALFIALAEDRRHVIIGIVAAAIAVMLPALASLGLDVPTSWFIVVATMVAATAGTVLFRE
ncbi:MAG: AzlC family ABC transporter permease [Actinomycetota bacterium]|nr:AzlC family ABC transporter permease [Actinomycetota bacterium]